MKRYQTPDERELDAGGHGRALPQRRPGCPDRDLRFRFVALCGTVPRMARGYRAARRWTISILQNRAAAQGSAATSKLSRADLADRRQHAAAAAISRGRARSPRLQTSRWRPTPRSPAARLQQPAGGEQDADLGDHSVDDVAVGVERFRSRGSGWARRRRPPSASRSRSAARLRSRGAVAIRNHDAPVEQGGLGLALARGSGNAVVRPIGTRDRSRRGRLRWRRPGCRGGGEAVELRDGRHDPLGAGHVERAGREQKIELRIDVDEYGLHEPRFDLVRSISSRSSRL